MRYITLCVDKITILKFEVYKHRDIIWLNIPSLTSVLLISFSLIHHWQIIVEGHRDSQDILLLSFGLWPGCFVLTACLPKFE